MIPPTPVVHVGAPDRECLLGLVLVPSPGASRIRVLYPSIASIGPTGALDVEGDVPHVSDQRRVPNPDGSSRWMLAWHTVDECERMTR